MFFVFAKTSEKEKLGNFMTTGEESPNFCIFSQPNKRKGFVERARASILLQQSSSFGFNILLQHVCSVFVAKLCCYNQSQHIIILLV
jgi:hypothetical protein